MSARTKVHEKLTALKVKTLSVIRDNRMRTAFLAQKMSPVKLNYKKERYEQ